MSCLAPSPPPRSPSCRRARSLLAKLLVLLAVWSVAGCTGATPEILRTRQRVRHVDNRETEQRYEQLELFVLATDDDGFDDLAALYLVHEEEELSWELDSSQWEQVAVGDERWIGSAGFVAPERGRIPRGRYRLIVEDVAGERGESSISVSAPELQGERYRGATIRVERNRVYLQSDRQTNRVELRDARGSLVRSFAAEPGDLTAAQLSGQSGGNGAGSLPRLVDLYVFSQSASGVLYVSGPYRL